MQKKQLTNLIFDNRTSCGLKQHMKCKSIANVVVDSKRIYAIRHLNDCNDTNPKPANVDLVASVGGHIGVLGFYPIFTDRH